MGTAGNGAIFGPGWMQVLEPYQAWTEDPTAGTDIPSDTPLQFQLEQDGQIESSELGADMGAAAPIGNRRFAMSFAADDESGSKGAPATTPDWQIAYDLGRKVESDLPVMVNNNPGEILPRLQSDMAKIPVGAGAEAIKNYILFALGELGYDDKTYHPDIFRAVHYLCAETARIANGLSNGDRFMSLFERVGYLHNKLRNPFYFALAWEKKFSESLTASDRERVADIIYIFGAWGQRQYAVRGGGNGDQFFGRKIAMLTLNAIRRYDILGLTEKAAEARQFMVEIQRRYGINTSEPRELVMADIGKEPADAWEYIAELIVRQKNNDNLGKAAPFIRVEGEDAGYEVAVWLNSAVADALARVDGGAKYVQFYRDRAAKARRIGVALGFIEPEVQ